CVEERDVLPPPLRVLLPETGQPLGRILRIPVDERQACFLGGDRGRADVDPEHSREPFVLAHTLMQHVLATRAVTREIRVRANVQVSVVEHRPHGKRLESLARVGIDKEGVVHRLPLYATRARQWWRPLGSRISERGPPPYKSRWCRHSCT